MKLRISDDLALPLEVTTQTMAILAKRRVGKSYTMRRIAEQLYKAGQQIVIVDPKGDQWGIRSAADGKAPGLPVVILGGERGDVPLEPSGGEIVAKLVVEERVSVLLDLSLFRKKEVAIFMADFLENLYRLKAREIFRTPMMLVVDEADAIAPQKPMPGEERMLGAIEDIVRRGGQRGIGCIVVTQRSAVLNKNVLTQAQILVALRTIAPQDLKAMKEWIDVHGEEAERKVLMDSLPSLPVGEAWFWSPGWPTTDGIFKRVQVLPIETFDSGATPKPGAKPVEPKRAADVDLEALKRNMAATIERAKADDPRELRKRIAELEREVAAKERTLQKVDDKTRVIETKVDRLAAIREERLKWEPLLKERDSTIRELQGKLHRIGKALAKGHAANEEIAGELAKELPALTAVPATEMAPPPVPPRRVEMPIRMRSAAAVRAATNGNGSVSGPQQRILDSLAWFESLSLPAPQKNIVAWLADASPTSSAFANNLGALRSAGLIDYPQQGVVALTDAGRAAANQPETPLTPGELQAAVFQKVSQPQRRILELLIGQYPEAIEKEVLAESAGASATSSAYANNLGALRSIGLIDYPERGFVVAKPVLFLEGR